MAVRRALGRIESVRRCNTFTHRPFLFSPTVSCFVTRVLLWFISVMMGFSVNVGGLWSDAEAIQWNSILLRAVASGTVDCTFVR